MIGWINSNGPLFTSLSAVVATLAFLYSIFQQRKTAREKELRVWQSVAIQSFLEKKGRVGVDIGEALQWYRTEATANAAGVSKSELTESACRRILIELVQGDIATQVAGGRFRLRVADGAEAINPLMSSLTEIMRPMMETMTPLAGDQRLLKHIYGVVAQAPFTRTVDTIIVEASQKANEPVENVRTSLVMEIGRNRLQIDANNKVGFGPMAVIGN